MGGHRHSMDKRSSVAASDTTYHSFNDVELFEPASPPRKTNASPRETISVVKPEQAPDSRPPTAYKMKRQDSGYESNTATPRTSLSSSRVSASRRTSNASIRNRTSTRPAAVHRSTRGSAHYPQNYSNSHSSLYLSRPSTQSQPHSDSYFHFPPLDPHPPKEEPDPPTPPIPQTTHYWTSDQTRRLEYAAIDAAQRGFTGWVRRNLVPDCLVPKDNRVVGFDDDTGSVRRYRLELEEDEPEKQKQTRRKTWHFWA